MTTCDKSEVDSVLPADPAAPSRTSTRHYVTARFPARERADSVRSDGCGGSAARPGGTVGDIGVVDLDVDVRPCRAVRPVLDL